MSTALRVRRLFARYGQVIAVAAVLSGLLAGYVAYDAYTNPPVDRITETTNQQKIETSGEISAVVTGNTSLYEPGKRLRNRPAYLLNASPELRLVTRTAAPSGSEIGHRVVLEYTASRNDRPFWRERRVLVAQNETATDGAVRSETTLDIRRIKSRIGAVRKELESVGTLELRVRANVTYDTGRYQGSYSDAMTMQVTENAYWLNGRPEGSDTRSTRNTRTRVQDPDPITYGGFGFLGLVAVAGGLAAAISGRRADVDELDEEVYRERYAEWISNGEFPTDTDKRYVTISSLEDLVDIAIDSNKRVIYDETLDAYGVADGDIVYYYGDEGDIDSWLDM